MKAFENYLENNLPKVKTFHPHFEKALEIMLKSGGKRFRPALLLSVVEAYEPLLVNSSYKAAMAIEALHTYSLIHDDLPAMDNADMRRGVETLHISYDEVTAILAGDALNTYAFELLSETAFSDKVKINLVNVLAKHGGITGMIIGQAVDCHFENQLLSLEQLKELHRDKTAKLIATALEMGAIIVDRDDLRQPLFDFGLELGLLFQVQDDILDQTQTTEQAGKTTNNDEGKNSFVNLLGLEGANKEADDLVSNLTQKLSDFDEKLQSKLEPLLQHYFNRHKG